jgi:hypothetical protein
VLFKLCGDEEEIVLDDDDDDDDDDNDDNDDNDNDDDNDDDDGDDERDEGDEGDEGQRLCSMLPEVVRCSRGDVSVVREE